DLPTSQPAGGAPRERRAARMAGASRCRYDERREKRHGPNGGGREKGAGAGGGVVRIAVSEHVLHGSALERLALARELQADGVELRFGPYDFEQHPLWLPGGP